MKMDVYKSRGIEQYWMGESGSGEGWMIALDNSGRWLVLSIDIELNNILNATGEAYPKDFPTLVTAINAVATVMEEIEQAESERLAALVVLDWLAERRQITAPNETAGLSHKHHHQKGEGHGK